MKKLIAMVCLVGVLSSCSTSPIKEDYSAYKDKTSLQLLQSAEHHLAKNKNQDLKVITSMLRGNNFIKDTNYEKLSLEDIIKKSSEEKKAGIFNNASQHWNHNLFWKCMKPNGGGNIPSKLENKIKQDFGSFEKFREEFINAGTTQFGSGWCWLSLKENKLVVTKSPNAENPIIYNMKP